MKNEIPIGMTKVKKSKREREREKEREREDIGDEEEHWSDNAQND